MGTVENVALWLAMWGAVLSTILAVKELILAYRAINKDRRRIKLTCEYHEDHQYGYPPIVAIRIVNVGDKPVKIVEAGYESTKGYRYNLVEGRETLDDENYYHTIWTQPTDFMNELGMLECERRAPWAWLGDGEWGDIAKAYAIDGEGNVYQAEFPEEATNYLESTRRPETAEGKDMVKPKTTDEGELPV